MTEPIVIKADTADPVGVPSAIDPELDVMAVLSAEVRGLRDAVRRLEAFATPKTNVEIEDILLTSDGQFDFLNISQDFRHLKIRFSVRSDRSGDAVDECLMRINNDSTAIYDGVRTSWLHNGGYVTNEQLGATRMIITEVAADLTPADSFAVGAIEIPDYSVAKKKTAFAYGGYHKTTGGGGQILVGGTGTWKSTAAITRITLFPEVGTDWLAGSRATLYGIG